jgi:AraC-like DNA-binding protein
MNHYTALPDIRPVSGPGMAHNHFSVKAEAPRRQLLAWRDRVGHIIDVLPSIGDLDKPFNASIDRYDLNGLIFTDCRSDQMVLERSIARISKDRVRHYAFHVMMEGSIDGIVVPASRGQDPTSTTGILALDLNQPVRMRRSNGRVLTFFAPGSLVQEGFPDPDSIHGRTLDNTTPLARLIIDHVTALSRSVTTMSACEANSAVLGSVRLMVAAFGKQARLSGNVRAAARAAMFGQVRRYIQANIHQADLSPESVLRALGLTRSTIYRLFQHEGGLVAYIRHLRLRQAADELARFPHVTVMEIAFGLGFNSASDFTRAFRRAYEMAPQDFRMSCHSPLSANTVSSQAHRSL